jgi:hypothetical protein
MRASGCCGDHCTAKIILKMEKIGSENKLFQD